MSLAARLTVIIALFFSFLLLSQASLKSAAQSQPAVVTASTSSELVTSKIKTTWPWYITRASGIVAAITLLLLMLSGIGQITGYTYKFLDPLPAWATHRALGISFLVSIFVHGLALLFDKFVPFNLWQLLVPFQSSYKHFSISGHSFGSLGVALGILAFYAMVAVTLSSLYWIDSKQRAWHLLHYLAYLIVVLVFFHALLVGTDIHILLVRILWILAGVIVMGSIFLRLWRAGTISKGKQ